MLQTPVEAAMSAKLAQRESKTRRRKLQIVTPLSSREIIVDERCYLHFSSNDYLGLSQHPKVLAAYDNAVAAGARASALVTGYTQQHAELCNLLVDVLERPRVLLFSSAFAANTGVLSSLGSLYSQLYLDRLAHASLLQGARQSGQRWRRFQHNEWAMLKRWLANGKDSSLCASESIFSMDGDALASGPAKQLIHQQPNCDLMLDDAHGFGICGDNGRSIAAEFTAREVGLLTLAFGKACGVAGGAVATDDTSADYLLNFCPELIYSTAMPPAQATAIKAAVELIVGTEGDSLRQQLQANIELFQWLCAASRLPVNASLHPIQTLRVGADDAAVKMSQQLAQQGIWCSAIRPPTVPEGTARLRITLTAAHTEHDIRQLVQALRRCFQEAAG